MDQLLRQARRESGLARYEREAQSMTRIGRVLVRRYLVPGTPEAGLHAILQARTGDILKRLQDARRDARAVETPRNPAG